MLQRRIEAVEVHNLLGIREGRVEGLGDVNVIVGRNGSGKSSLLEAIFLASGLPQHSLHGPLSHVWVADCPGGTVEGKIPWLYARRNVRDLQMPAEYGPPNVLAAILPVDYVHGRLPGVESSVGLDVRTEDTGSSRWQFVARRQQDRFLPDAKCFSGFPSWIWQFLGDAAFLDGRLISEDTVEKVLWDAVVKLNWKPKLLGLFNLAYRYKAKDVDYVRKDDRYYIAPADGGIALPLDNLGAGMRIGFRLLLIALLCQDTFLLLEEFDAYQHPESLRNIVSGLLRVCKENRLQLFATTHRAESIQVFLDCLEQDDLKELDGRIVATALDMSGQLKSRTIPFEDARGLHDGGFDFRKVEDFIE